VGKNNKISGKRSGPPPKSGPTPQGFGYDFDSMDNKPFIYGFKDTEKALIRGAAKSKKDFNIGSYSKNFKIEASKNEFVGKQIRAGAKKGGFEFEVGKNDHGKNFRISFKKKFNMGGSAKCPHRDSSSKNMYPGNNGIQVKGFKFTGVK
jgi:hypothetical protein